MRQGLSKSLIERVLDGKPKWTINELENKFPPRNLPDGAMITRFAPSPTGFMHLGNLYSMLIDYKLAKQSGGIFFIRVEDTDTKRKVEGALDVILKTAERFKFTPDEGPYYQSERRDIYHSVVSEMLADGRAYPCFLSVDEMEEIRKKQTAEGLVTGIYGKYAKWKDASEEEIVQKLDENIIPSIRLYSFGSKERRLFCKDAVRGSISFPENEEDVVLIKSNDGLPTYHFAHVVDDHFMHTTHVIRGEEWLPSLPLHIQIFNILKWISPAYIHTSTLDTIDIDTGKQRKLSKRKDRMANVDNFIRDGWPEEAVLEYLFNILNSSYEENKAQGKVKNIWDSELKIKEIPKSGALFDRKKLEWWSKEFIATMSVDELAEKIVQYVNEYGEDQKEKIKDLDYLKRILSIERDDLKRIRKDFITWKQTLMEIDYFFKDPNIQDIEKINKDVLEKFIASFDINDPKDLWWDKIVKIASELGIRNGEAAMSLRVALTDRTATPDLYSIMQVMGDKKVRERITSVVNKK